MYEMYPEAWPIALDQRQQTGPGDKPRRRVRKEHSVMPPVLVASEGSVRALARLALTARDRSSS